jgi:hypothetical protein
VAEDRDETGCPSKVLTIQQLPRARRRARRLLSWSCALPQRPSGQSGSAVSVGHSPCTLSKPVSIVMNRYHGPVGPAPRILGSSHQNRRPSCRPELPAKTLAELRLLQSLTTGCHRALRSSCTVPPRAYRPSSAYSTGKPRSIRRAYLTRLRSAYRISHPLDGLLLPEPPGLVSSR